jgi:hypothetical protein
VQRDAAAPTTASAGAATPATASGGATTATDGAAGATPAAAQAPTPAPPPTRAPMPTGGTLQAVPQGQIPPNVASLVDPADASLGQPKTDDFRSGPQGAQNIDTIMAGAQDLAQAAAQLPTVPEAAGAAAATPASASAAAPATANVGTAAEVMPADDAAKAARLTSIQPQLDALGTQDPASLEGMTEFLANAGKTAPHPSAVPSPTPSGPPAITPPAIALPAGVDTGGLASQVSMGAFVGAAHTVEGQWAALATPEARATPLGTAAAAQLTAAGVPATGTVVKAMGANGELDFQNWNLDLNRTLFDKPAVTTEEMSAAADTVYHEARHGEQWHQMARIYAGKYAQTPAEIATNMTLKLSVAQDAHAKKYDPSIPPPAAFTAWFESVYGTGAAHRNTTLTQMGVKGREVKAKSAESNAKGTERETKCTEATAKKTEKDAKATEWTAKKAEVDPASADATTKQTTLATKTAETEAKAVAWRAKKATLDAALTTWQTAKADEEAKTATWHAKSTAYNEKAAAAALKEDALNTLGQTVTQSATARQTALTAYNGMRSDYERLLDNPAATDAAKTTALGTVLSHYNNTLTPAWNAHKANKDAWTAADAEFQAAKAEFDAAEAEFNTADAEWRTAHTAKAEAEAAWNAANAELALAYTEWDTANQAKTAATTESQTADATLARLNGELAAIYNAYVPLKADWDRLTAELAVLDADWQRLFAEYQALDAVFQPLYTAYRALPEEVDAWRTGEAIKKMYKERFGGGGGT